MLGHLSLVHHRGTYSNQQGVPWQGLRCHITPPRSLRIGKYSNLLAFPRSMCLRRIVVGAVEVLSLGYNLEWQL